MSSMLTGLSQSWQAIQTSLFPWLKEELGELTEKQQQLITTLEIISLDESQRTLAQQQKNAPNIWFASNLNDRLISESWYDGTQVSYSYDNAGNRTAATTDANGTASYSYDSQHRLLQETKADGTMLDYSYDDAGNKSSLITTVNGSLTTTSYTYDDQ